MNTKQILSLLSQNREEKKVAEIARLMERGRAKYLQTTQKPHRDIVTPFLVTGNTSFDTMPYMFDVCQFEEEGNRRPLLLLNKHWCWLSKVHDLPVNPSADPSCDLPLICRDCGETVEEEMKDIRFPPYETTVAEFARCKSCWNYALVNPGSVLTICAGCGYFGISFIEDDDITTEQCFRALYLQKPPPSPKKRERSSNDEEDRNSESTLDLEQMAPSPKRIKKNGIFSTVETRERVELLPASSSRSSSVAPSPLQTPIRDTRSPRRLPESSYSSSTRVVYHQKSSSLSSSDSENRKREEPKHGSSTAAIASSSISGTSHEPALRDPVTGNAYCDLYFKANAQVDELKQKIKNWEFRYHAELDKNYDEQRLLREEMGLLRQEIRGERHTVDGQRTGLARKNRLISRLEEQIIKLGGIPITQQERAVVGTGSSSNGGFLRPNNRRPRGGGNGGDRRDFPNSAPRGK